MKKVICALMVVCMLVGLCGCTKTPYEVVARQITSDEETLEYIETNPDEEFINATADFAAELFARTYAEGKNSLVSPVSVMLCLGMVANGASEDTLKEFEEVLGQDITIEELNQHYATYRKMLVNGSNKSVSIANSIWIKDWEKFVVKEDFVKKNETFYGAEIYQAPFDRTTVNDINHWVNENTNGMIPSIINELSEDDLMVLINALAFEGEWVNPYYSDQVRDYNFTNINGKVEIADGLRCYEYAYMEDENTVGFVKNYTNGYKLVVFLPDEDVNFSEYVTSFTGEKYLGLVKNIQDVKTFTIIPKFTYDYEIKLNQTLIDMGISSAFDYKIADFSGMYEENDDVRDVCISEVIHKTHIELGEKGTKAAAVTAVVMKNAGASPEEPKEVVCDRPFVYAIVDGETMLPVFIGSVSTIS